ncbi:succinate dehydrogenase cytochrome b558 subunit [Planococcus sp. A6]|nr:succinate dehydrogenase cytochrome b558 subunit [Planococcus sp. A6]
MFLRGVKFLDNNREFLMRRLHSLLGVIPIGLFLTQHLIVNHFATQGVEAFNQAAHFMANLPFVIFLEIFVIYLPLMYHAFYGLYIAFTAKNNPGHYSYMRNMLFVAQRYTGVFLVVFIAWHIFETRFQVAIGAGEADFNMMENILSNPLMFAFYVVGVLSATFHFANGLWSFFVTWGITVSAKAQRYSTYFTLLVFIVLSIIGIRALFAFV